jgi:hypothetical protein
LCGGNGIDGKDVSERYIAKSSPWIVIVSTPNAPEWSSGKIEREPEDTCLYKRLFLDYTYGLDKIYTREEIALAQKSPTWVKLAMSSTHWTLRQQYVLRRKVRK